MSYYIVKSTALILELRIS